MKGLANDCSKSTHSTLFSGTSEVVVSTYKLYRTNLYSVHLYKPV